MKSVVLVLLCEVFILSLFIVLIRSKYFLFCILAQHFSFVCSQVLVRGLNSLMVLVFVPFFFQTFCF